MAAMPFYFENNPVIAVAVSGGPDSMALLHLLNQLTRVVAVTVEHGLRSESLAEAKSVGAWCKKHKIEHHILEWHGAKPKSALHETARAARYELLEKFCREKNILHLATAHHADDQAETILQRIAKASGPMGLAGMAEHSFAQHLHVWRPFLHVRKAELIAYCEAQKILFVRDASNENLNYARGRLRGAAEVLAAEGLTVENLNLLAQKQRGVVEVLENATVKFLAAQARLIAGVGGSISADHFALQPIAVQQHALAYVLKLVSAGGAPIRYESLSDMCGALTTPGFRARTLGHCRIMHKKINKQNFIRITPEALSPKR